MAAALAYRDFMVANHTDAGQVAWLAGKGIDLIRGTGALAGPGAVEVDGRRTRPGTSWWPPARIRSSRRSPACASWTACGPTARRPP